MKQVRSISKLFSAKPTIEGAGVHLNRLFGHAELSQFDPFLLLDDFSSHRHADYIKGFPWHPHRGIETITYVLKGSVTHKDSIGNTGTIAAGDVQWMTAGSGIIHEEMPQGDSQEQMVGFQLWVNLPAKDKMTTPRYHDVKSSQIPLVHLANRSLVRVIGGTFDNVQGPVDDIFVEPLVLDVNLEPNSEFVCPTPPNHTFFTYVYKGSGAFGTCTPQPAHHAPPVSDYNDASPAIMIGSVVLFSSGDFITVATAEQPVHFMLVGGKPLNEPVAWYGPIVMNTEEELAKAFEEFQVGLFVKHDTAE